MLKTALHSDLNVHNAPDLGRCALELPGRRIEWLASTASTMKVAAELAHGGCAPGTIVVADEQTAGVGRHGRKWISEPGGGLYASIVLRLPMSPVLTLALGLAARDAIAETASLTPDLRWPNDILLNEKKCGGILAQVEGSAIIAGIGINLSQRAFPDGLDTPATSLALEGAIVDREDLLVALAHAVDRYCEILREKGTDEITRLFVAASSYASGRRVRAEGVEGVTCGLNPSGFLLIRADDGTMSEVVAGGVRPV